METVLPSLMIMGASSGVLLTGLAGLVVAAVYGAEGA